MEFQPVDSKAIALWRWETLFSCLPLWLPIAALVRLPLAVALPAVLLLLVLTGWLVAWYPPAKYRRLGYRADINGITIRSGVWWRKQSAVARVRIQHTDVYQGPLQRLYGVATLKLYTAGSHHARIDLPGLSHATALALRAELQREDNGDAV